MFDASPERDPHAAHACQSLWCAVLSTVIQDATGSVASLYGEGAGVDASIIRREVLRRISEGSIHAKRKAKC